jgi:hypothetical protein
MNKAELARLMHLSGIDNSRLLEEISRENLTEIFGFGKTNVTSNLINLVHGHQKTSEAGVRPNLNKVSYKIGNKTYTNLTHPDVIVDNATLKQDEYGNPKTPVDVLADEADVQLDSSAGDEICYDYKNMLNSVSVKGKLSQSLEQQSVPSEHANMIADYVIEKLYNYNIKGAESLGL